MGNEERPIRFELLHKDELIYEVSIRNETPADTVAELRKQIKKLVKDSPSDAIDVFEGDDITELRSIQTKLDELESLCSAKPLFLKSLNRINALGNHLFHRLSRLSSVAQDNLVFRDELNSRLEGVSNRIETMFSTFRGSKSPDESFQDADDKVGGSKVVESRSLCDHSAAVHKLNLLFDGKEVLNFLLRLGELCRSRGISDDMLYRSAAELFSGDALYWYRSIESEVSNWSELKDLLLEEYLPVDYDLRLMQEIRSRTQGPEESISSYLTIMSNYFSRLRSPLGEEEKLNLVKYNLRPFYSSQLALFNIDSWKQLKDLGRRLEQAKLRGESFVEPSRTVSNSVAPDLVYKGKVPRTLVSAAEAGKNFCVRCRVDGHILQNCKAPRIVLCFRCGKKDETTLTCPNCNKNSRSGPKNE